MNRKASLAWLLLLQGLDAVTTTLAARAGVQELNPLVSMILGSPWLFLSVKLSVGWLVWLLIGNSRAAMLVVSLIYLQAIVANTLNLLNHQGF